MQALLLRAAQNYGLIYWKSGAGDVSYRYKGKRYKGKDVPIHLFVDADGMPLVAYSAPTNKYERKYFDNLIENVSVKGGKAAQEREKADGRQRI